MSCHGLTLKGLPCKGKVKAGQEWCFRHKPAEEKKEEKKGDIVDIEDVIPDPREMKRLALSEGLPPELQKRPDRECSLEGIADSNAHDRNLFYAYLDGKLSKKQSQLVILNRERKPVWDWADCTVNTMDPRLMCPNNCLYCYTKYECLKAGYVREKSGRYVSRPDRVKKGYRKLAKGVRRTRMIFSSHDIFLEGVEDFLLVCGKLIKAGYDLLIVSKMRLEVAKRIASAVKAWGDRAEIRITIGSVDPETVRYWEPGAPTPAERLQSLFYFLGEGLKVSISMEPLLGDDPRPFVDWIGPKVKSIWIGEMNYFHTFENECDGERLEKVKRQNESLLAIVTSLRGNPKVFWKSSVVKSIKALKGRESFTDEMNENSQRQATIVAELATRFG